MSHLSASLFDIQLDLIREHQQQLRVDAALARLLRADQRRAQSPTSVWCLLQRLLGLNAMAAEPLSSPPSPISAFRVNSFKA
jgi:hypothetical protein